VEPDAGSAGSGTEETKEMSVYEVAVSPLPQGSIATFRVVSFVEALVDRFTARYGARSTVRELRALSDSQLADVGLNRGEIDELARDLAGI
jgi:uncharacterized protein YjiS (DUF1127 family)